MAHSANQKASDFPFGDVPGSRGACVNWLMTEASLFTTTIEIVFFFSLTEEGIVRISEMTAIWTVLFAPFTNYCHKEKDKKEHKCLKSFSLQC